MCTIKFCNRVVRDKILAQSGFQKNLDYATAKTINAMVS